MQKVFVYFHRKASDNSIFYVGIGVKFRPYRKSRRSLHWNRIVNKYGLIIEIKHTVDTWEEAAILEKKYISEIGRIDQGKGTLVNYTDGGDGTLGCKWNIGRKASEETKIKQSISLKGRKPHQNTIDANKLVNRKGQGLGKIISDETRKKISDSKKGTIATKEHKHKVSQKLKGRIISDYTRQRSSEVNTGRKVSEETKRKLSESAKRQWAEGNTWFNKVA